MIYNCNLDEWCAAIQRKADENQKGNAEYLSAHKGFEGERNKVIPTIVTLLYQKQKKNHTKL